MQYIHCYCLMSKAGGHKFFLFIDSLTSRFYIRFTFFLKLCHQRLSIFAKFQWLAYCSQAEEAYLLHYQRSLKLFR